MKTKSSERPRCTVCGAKLINREHQCTTCSPLCTRAKKNGRTREEQTLVEIEVENQEAAMEDKHAKKWNNYHYADENLRDPHY